MAKSLFRTMQKLFVEYCVTSTIHGLRYLTDRKSHWTEKCWWIIAMAAAIGICGALIQNVCIKWHVSPVTMEMNEKQGTKYVLHII